MANIVGLNRTSRPEVRKIVKIRTVRKLDIFLPGRRTFEIRKKIKKKKIQIFFSNFFNFFFHKMLVQVDTVNGRKASAHCTLVRKASAHWTERPQISAI